MPRAQRAPWIGREKGQPNWYIYWYNENTGRVKRRSSGTCIRGEAEKALGHFLIERASETKNIGPIATPDRYLIATALRWYVQERGAELVSAEFTGFAIGYLLNFFGAKAVVGCITPQLLKQYGQQRKRKVRYVKTQEGTKKIVNNKPISSSTIRRELSVLAAALNHAIKNGRLTSAPKIILPPNAPHRTRYLEREEIERLLENCIEPHIRLFVLLALNTGSRKGALLDLRWPQVDMVNKIIYLNPIDRAQTNKRRAIVPINNSLYAALTKAKEAAKEAQEKREAKGDNTPPCPYVITYHNAPVLNMKKGFMEACARAGIENVTPHTLRHTAGTLMALAGIDLFLIAKVLGHSVQKTTELYAHHRPEYLRDAVNVLSIATG
jgi:integrase